MDTGSDGTVVSRLSMGDLSRDLPLCRSVQGPAQEVTEEPVTGMQALGPAYFSRMPR